MHIPVSSSQPTTQSQFRIKRQMLDRQQPRSLPSCPCLLTIGTAATQEGCARNYHPLMLHVAPLSNHRPGEETERDADRHMESI